ncbi:sigma-70 family RNA polymerase sigma factor [Myxococcus sp. CA056]|uniref:RNA polymerase sigma factor n=1 Tax=Myxococcus sp. CA056 TaxID=2741740 RepID=UPI00157B7A7B|nr:sigma-70 family RNA polymerase sigma factor [Myxococcus sp. CA056]NTX12604.1 sigma-70 family RNA polymerase sigma factor [Myxococcus sp. CA056]
MSPKEREALEQRIRERCTLEDTAGAVEAAVEGYGPEIRRLLGTLLREPEQAREAFSIFCESLVRDLPGFRWESTFRTWAYRVARNVAYRMATAFSPGRERVASREMVDLMHVERSGTAPWLQTSVKDRFRSLRAQLEPGERNLLLLRVDRRMSWLDVARELGGTQSSEGLQRKAAVLRQQFKSLKERLRELARDDRLISSA